jgi:hypothetical protein
MQGVRDLGADSFVGDPFPAGHLTFQLDGRGDGGSWRTSRANDGDGGGSRAGRGKAKEEGHSMEDLRRRYSWWPSGSGKEGQPSALIDIEAGEGEGTALRSIKRTKL